MNAFAMENEAGPAASGATSVFLDTEFSSLASPELLSIGLVADERRECYVELAPDLQRVNAFARRPVLPRWGRVPGSAASPAQLGRCVDAWLSTLAAASIYVVHDHDTDFELLQGALRAAAAWHRWSVVLVPLKVGYLASQPISGEAMDLSWTASFRQDGIHRHHALADARALRAGCRARQDESGTRIDRNFISFQARPTPYPSRIFP